MNFILYCANVTSSKKQAFYKSGNFAQRLTVQTNFFCKIKVGLLPLTLFSPALRDNSGKGGWSEETNQALDHPQHKLHQIPQCRTNCVL